MFPILISLGPFHIFSLSFFLILAWCGFSFLFWRSLKSQAVAEERIFDLMFWATIISLVSSRVGFVLLHLELFAGSILKVLALWVQPGLSFLLALVGGVVTLLVLGRRYSVRLAYIFDSLALALPWAVAIGSFGSLLDGSEIGKMTRLPWAIQYLGQPGWRHPIQIYQLLVAVTLGLGLVWLKTQARRKEWPFGLVGIWFFMCFAASFFILEFIKESHVYWYALSPNQWILILIFGQALGVWYVRGGAREKLRPLLRRNYASLREKAKQLYERIYQRHS